MFRPFYSSGPGLLQRAELQRGESDVYVVVLPVRGVHPGSDRLLLLLPGLPEVGGERGSAERREAHQGGGGLPAGLRNLGLSSGASNISFLSCFMLSSLLGLLMLLASSFFVVAIVAIISIVIIAMIVVIVDAAIYTDVVIIDVAVSIMVILVIVTFHVVFIHALAAIRVVVKKIFLCVQIGTLEQFLASTFRPSDSVCIHVDAKAEDLVWEAAKAVVNCYK